jgi:hypothetical protein
MVGHWLMLLLVQLQSDQQTLLYQVVMVVVDLFRRVLAPGFGSMSTDSSTALRRSEFGLPPCPESPQTIHPG